MNSKGIVSMSNKIGFLLQGMALGEKKLHIEDMIEKSDAVSVYMPDEGIDCKGWKDCVEALCRFAEKSYKTIDLTHSAAWKECEDGALMGHWNTYTYQLYSDDTGMHMLYSYWRITVTFVFVSNDWKMRSFSRLKLLHVSPWDYDSNDEPAVWDNDQRINCIYPESDVLPQDYVELRNLAGHISHDGLAECGKLFAVDHNIYIDLPDILEEPVYGRTKVMETFDMIARKEHQNLEMYPQFITMCTPVIYTHGEEAVGDFVGNLVNFRGPAYGYKDVPYRMQYRLAKIHFDYVQEHGVWKILGVKITELCKINDLDYYNINHDGLDNMPGMVEYMGRNPNRNFAPRWKGCKNCAEDIFEIESLLPQWTERLKRNDLSDFPDLFMVNKQHAPVIQLTNSYVGYEAVMSHCRKMINGIYEGHESMWNNPQFHTGCSPVIELSYDGNSAKAWFVDKCWGNIGKAAEYDGVIDREYLPGFGTYCHELIKENGKWRLWHFGWTPMVGGWTAENPKKYVYKYRYGETGGWSVNNHGKAWPLPFETFEY